MNKQSVIKRISHYESQVIQISNFIFDNPEIGDEEIKASKLISDFLKNNGFNVELGVAGLPTAFKASYFNKCDEKDEGVLSIGLLCEYDALEDFGHGCAHHIQGPSIIAAAASIKNIVKENPYKLYVFGTPGEETTAGKITMLNEGVFNCIDIALMVHGSDITCVDEKSLALSELEVEYHGRSAHAAISPDKGRSALDAVITTFNGVEYLREHISSDVRIHGIITNGGKVLNIVPEEAACQFGLRAETRGYLNSVIERFKKIVEGAALITETKYRINRMYDFDNKIPVYSLNNLVMDNAKLVGCPRVSPPRKKTGSTDFANVMHMIPGTCLRIAFVPEGTFSHSEDFLAAGKSDNAHKAIVYSAKTIAATCFDLITDSNLAKEIKEEHRKKLADEEGE